MNPLESAPDKTEAKLDISKFVSNSKAVTKINNKHRGGKNVWSQKTRKNMSHNHTNKR